MSIDLLQGTISSIFSVKDPLGTFIALNLCACVVVFAFRKWKSSSHHTARPATPDLEKPASRFSNREKITRKFGGM
jgi:hypothetical protein